MIIQVSVNSIMDCMERTERHIQSFPNNMFGPTLVGILGECAVCKWARDEGLSPKWEEPGSKYSVPDIVLKRTTIDVKSSKTFDIERGKWFSIEKEALLRITKHSTALVFTGINIGKISREKNEMYNTYRSGIGVEILGWFPTRYILKSNGIVPKTFHNIDRLRELNGKA